MTRYFFDIRQHAHTMADEEGEELGSLAEAEERALAAAREIMGVMAAKGIDASDGEIAILNEARQNVLIVHFKDVV